MMRELGLGSGRGGVVSDLTLKSVSCPSSPGVTPHSQVGAKGAGGKEGYRALEYRPERRRIHI